MVGLDSVLVDFLVVTLELVEGLELFVIVLLLCSGRETDLFTDGLDLLSDGLVTDLFVTVVDDLLVVFMFLSAG
jgi:hypothetical protein